MSLIWHQIKERPLTEPDASCFVLCLGKQGWSCGTLTIDSTQKFVIHGNWKPFPTVPAEMYYVRQYAFLDKTEIPRPRYESKARKVTKEDKGKFIVGKGPPGWHCGMIGINGGFPVVMHNQDSITGAISANALTTYTLIDPSELPPHTVSV